MIRVSQRDQEASHETHSPDLDLPDDLNGAKFDVIVVDAPQGFAPEKPGRMKSIYMSQGLSHEDSHVFVDDIERRVERIYSEVYLRPKFGDPVIMSGREGFAHFRLRKKK